MLPIKIRKYRLSDKELFLDLFSESIQKDFSEYSEKLRKGFTDSAFTRGVLFAKIKLLALSGKDLVGFITADQFPGGVVIVYWLMVKKEFHGKGIGSLLLLELEKLGKQRGAHALHIECVKRNLEYYKKKGFTLIGLDAQGFFGTDNYLLKKLIQKPQEDRFFEVPKT